MNSINLKRWFVKVSVPALWLLPLISTLLLVSRILSNGDSESSLLKSNLSYQSQLDDLSKNIVASLSQLAALKETHLNLKDQIEANEQKAVKLNQEVPVSEENKTEIEQLRKSLDNTFVFGYNIKISPRFEYQQAVSRLTRNVQEMANFLQDKMRKPQEQNTNELIYELKHNIEIIKKRDADFLDYEFEQTNWWLLNRIKTHQQPKLNSKCNRAKKIVCKLNQLNCSFACLLHHSLYCFLFSLAVDRILYISWPDQHLANPWDNGIFEILGKCKFPQTNTHWTPKNLNSTEALVVPPIDDYQPSFKPQQFPEELSTALHFTDDPFAWFVGNVLTYLVRNEKLDYDNRAPANQPIVGIHLDDEDSLEQLVNYVKHVNSFFNYIEAKNFKRKNEQKIDRLVYLSSAKSFELKNSSFDKLKFIKSKSFVNKPVKAEEIKHYLINLQTFVRCDLLICPLKYPFCRLAYALVHSKRRDASNAFLSVDGEFNLTQTDVKLYQAIGSFRSPTFDATFDRGDHVIVKKKLLNGYYFGGRNDQNFGLFPSFKVNLKNKFSSFKALIEPDD